MSPPTRGPLYELIHPILEAGSGGFKPTPGTQDEQADRRVHITDLVKARLIALWPDDDRLVADWPDCCRYVYILNLEIDDLGDRLFEAIKGDVEAEQAVAVRNGRVHSVDDTTKKVLAPVILQVLTDYLVDSVVEILDGEQDEKIAYIMMRAMDTRLNDCIGPTRDQNRYNWALFAFGGNPERATWRAFLANSLGVYALASCRVDGKSYWVLANHLDFRSRGWRGKVAMWGRTFVDWMFRGLDAVEGKIRFQVLLDKPTPTSLLGDEGHFEDFYTLRDAIAALEANEATPTA